MTAWSDGYFTDVQYLRKFFPSLAPGVLSLACLRQGIRPPELGAGSTYLELGCGQGFGLNLLAAANPAMRFWGIDFHPAQIANAQQLARTAGLTNVTFDDLSFSQVLDLPEGRIPRCDVIALHGVLSWISPENRALIVRILDRHLKPGGLAMVSYNVLPGWAPLMPLRQFVKACFDRTSGPPRTRAMDAFRLAKDLATRDTRALGSPQIKGMIEDALKRDPAYLIHEYLNEHFHPMYHADVARELQDARLSFVATVSAADGLTSLAAPEPMQGLIQDETDPIWRETLADYANRRMFRSDVFVRGPTVLSASERETLLGSVTFRLIKPPGQVKYEFKIPIGSVAGDPAVYDPLLAALSEGPRTYADLAQLPAFAADGAGRLERALGLLVAAGVTHPSVPGDADGKSAQSFNRAMLERLTPENAPTYLAAPAIGAGAAVGFTELLFLAAPARKPDFQALARRSWELMSPRGIRYAKDGKTLSTQADHEAEAIARLKTFQAENLPLLRALGVI